MPIRIRRSRAGATPHRSRSPTTAGSGRRTCRHRGTGTCARPASRRHPPPPVRPSVRPPPPQCVRRNVIALRVLTALIDVETAAARGQPELVARAVPAPRVRASSPWPRAEQRTSTAGSSSWLRTSASPRLSLRRRVPTARLIPLTLMPLTQAPPPAGSLRAPDDHTRCPWTPSASCSLPAPRGHHQSHTTSYPQLTSHITQSHHAPATLR